MFLQKNYNYYIHYILWSKNYQRRFEKLIQKVLANINFNIKKWKKRKIYAENYD